MRSRPRGATSPRPVVNRSIARLALPALGTLAADPLVSAIDTAFVGRISPEALAALGVNSAIFALAFFAFNFLAYGTTPLVAEALGRRDFGAADRTITQAMAVAVGFGLVSLLVLEVGAEWWVRLLQAPEAVQAEAVIYLRIRALAAPAVLVIIAGNGAFRGLQDTVTPLKVTLGLNLVNLVLDPLLIFGAGWGIAGAATATAIAQWVGALWFVGRLRTRWRGMRSVQRGELFGFLSIGWTITLRTASLLVALAVATATAGRIGVDAVAAHQVVMQLWLLLALTVDALAVAGQALVAKAIGEGDTAAIEAIVRRLAFFGLGAGVVLAIGLLAIRPWLGVWFGIDAAVEALAVGVIPLVAAMQPIGGLLFVGDGVYLGAARFRFLAWGTAAGGAVAIALLLGWAGSRSDLVGIWTAVAAMVAVRLIPQVVQHARRGSVLAGGSPAATR